MNICELWDPMWHYSILVTYRVIQEESAILWEMTVCVILSKKVHINMGPILNGWSVSSFYHISVTVQNRTHVHMNYLLRITHTIISQSTADSSLITLYNDVRNSESHIL